MGKFKEKSIAKQQKEHDFNKCVLEILKELEKGARTERQLVIRTAEKGYPASRLSEALTYLKNFDFVYKSHRVKGRDKVVISRIGKKKLEAMMFQNDYAL